MSAKPTLDHLVGASITHDGVEGEILSAWYDDSDQICLRVKVVSVELFDFIGVDPGLLEDKIEDEEENEAFKATPRNEQLLN